MTVEELVHCIVQLEPLSVVVQVFSLDFEVEPVWLLVACLHVDNF